MSYTIQSGDSLWGIANQQCGAKSIADIQEIINKIVELNNLGSKNATIFAGESLKLPTDIFESSTKQDNTSQNTTDANQSAFEFGGQDFEFISIANEDLYQQDLQEFNIFTFINMVASGTGLEKLLSNVTSIFGTSETEETQGTSSSETSSSGETKEEQQQKYEEKLKSTANGQFKSLDEQETVTYDNFLDWYKQGITAQKREVYSQNESQLKTAFDALDTNGDSNLDATEIENMYEAFNKIDQEIDKMIKKDKLDNPEEEQRTLTNA